MSVLFFPDVNALRLALASGLVDRGVALAPAVAGVDAHGHVWLEPAELPPRESLAGLARLGVRALGAAGVPTSAVGCWAELLPLQPDAGFRPALTLFLVPDKQLARFVACLRTRTRQPLGVRLPDAGPPGRGWVAVADSPAGLLAECAEPDSPVEAFAQQAPGVWVRHGWRHPLPEQLAVPVGGLLLVRPPRDVVAVPVSVPAPVPDEFRLRGRTTVPARPPRPAPPVPVRLTLAPSPRTESESLWVFDPQGEAGFLAYCSAADERLVRRLEAASVEADGRRRVVIRTTGKSGAALPFAPRGFVPDARLPNLFLPADTILRPTLRVRELAAAVGVVPGLVVWVEPSADGLTTHAVPESAFRPVSALVEYQTPPATALDVLPRGEPFPLSRFVVPSDPVEAPEPELDLAAVADEPGEPAPPEPARGEPGWFLRSLKKLVTRVKPGRVPGAPAPGGEPEAAPPGRRVGRKIDPPDALLHGPDRAARRRELEGRLFRDLPRLGVAGRAERWADLAAVYTATGNALDAAVCWMNAAWEAPAPPPEWLDLWLAAECRAAKLPAGPDAVERWLGEPGRAGVGRAVAAHVAATGFAPTTPAGFPGALPRLLAVLDQNLDDVPVRGVWLARLAAARACDGDALGLARWRDRLLARLAERGPGLDLDEPSFLRFHGTASAERFHTAREWLVRMHDPVLNWVQRPAGGRLPWVGIDAETDATAAFARFLLAWGLGCLGERTRSKDWAARARKGLARAGGFRVDPAAQGVLGDLFLLRVRDAQEGRAAKPGLPPDLLARFAALPEHAAYAVQRLREHSRVLEPLDRPRAFRGTDLKVFWGTDRLGERLSVLAAATDPAQVAAEADALLALCHQRPATDTLPRVVLTLLDLAPWLDRAALLRLLDLMPTAIDWLEPLLLTQPWADGERAGKVVAYAGRMLDAAFAAAAAHPADAVGPAVSTLLRRLVASGDAARAPLRRVGETVFRALRKLGLNGEAEAVVRFTDPGPNAPVIDQLGVACGWFLAGDEDAAGTRALDEAREILFRSAWPDTRVSTPLAVAYAAALGFAAPRVALGRLEELFQRLGRLDPLGANSHFTLAPLQLVDTVVRSVVTDEFALNPAVRGWLADDEFLIRGRIHRDLAAVLREQDIR